MLLNNMCEVFNGQLLDDRDRPIINSLEYAREYLMKRTVTVLQTIAKSDGPLTPTATKLFQAIKNEAIECVAQWNEGHLYAVTGPYNDKCVVNVSTRTYTVDVGVPETWVHPCYRLDTWKGKLMWPKSNIPTIILPPNHHPQVNKTAATTRRGASASSVKASASGSKVATHKGNNTSASVKVAASSSKVATHKGNNTFASVKVAASGSKDIQPSGNVKGGNVKCGNVKTVGKVKGAATGSKAAAQNGKKMLQQVEKDQAKQLSHLGMRLRSN
ncbi:hypothetical protein Tco_0327765 [Tanacetum coccineum]